MKIAISSLVALALGSRFCIAASRPDLQHDPATTKDCIDWYNNVDGRTCQETRDLFKISPEEFAKWNPSVGVDCHMWIWASYCVLTQEKLNRLTSKTTSTSKPAPTSITSNIPGTTTTITEMGKVAQTRQASSGAMRNVALF